jgi:hypothetical protein
MDSAYNWLHDGFHSQAPADVKVEAALESSVFTLLSPPSSPHTSRSVPTESAVIPVSAPSRRRSNTSIASSKRVKPYPISTRELYFRGEDTGPMANTWSPTGSNGGSGRAHFPVEPPRRSSDGDQQGPPSYGLPNTFTMVSPTIQIHIFLPNCNVVCSIHLVDVPLSVAQGRYPPQV